MSRTSPQCFPASSRWAALPYRCRLRARRSGSEDTGTRSRPPAATSSALYTTGRRCRRPRAGRPCSAGSRGSTLERKHTTETRISKSALNQLMVHDMFLTPNARHPHTHMSPDARAQEGAEQSQTPRGGLSDGMCSVSVGTGGDGIAIREQRGPAGDGTDKDTSPRR